MRIKRLLLLSLSLLFLSACKDTENQSKPVIVEEVVINHIDLYPQYPGCEDFYEQNIQLKCLIEKMNNFINYMIEKKYRREFSDLKDTLWVQFEIDTTGNTLHSGIICKDSLKKQVFDSIFSDISGKIPILKPAVYQDKPVNFIFKIPIVNLNMSLYQNNVSN